MIPKPTKSIAAVSPAEAAADTTMAAHANDGTGLALETKKKKWKDMDKSEKAGEVGGLASSLRDPDAEKERKASLKYKQQVPKADELAPAPVDLASVFNL